MIEPICFEKPSLWRGSFKIENLQEIKKNLANITNQIESTGCSLEIGNSISTVECDEYRPHKTSHFYSFYKKLFDDLVKLHFVINRNQFVRPHKTKIISDTGFFSIEYDQDEKEFQKEYELKSEYYNKVLLDNFFLIDNSWFNIHKKHGKTLEHDHKGNDYVCSYYLNVPENSGNFLIKKDNTWYSIPVKTGDYLIFSGNTVHATEESFSDEDRIVVTTNIVIKEY